MSIEQLITSGSALTILAAIVLAFYSGKVVTKAAHEATLSQVTAVWEARFADERAEKEAWKSQAQQLTPSVASMAAELESANERDDAWKAALMEQISKTPDRRARA